MTESKPHACECGLWRYREGQSEVSTGCNRQVSGSRRFAEGHDPRPRCPEFSSPVDTARLNIERLSISVVTMPKSRSVSFGASHD